MWIDDIDEEVLIITKEPTFIIDTHKANCQNAASNANEEKQYDTMDNTKVDENFPWLDEFTTVMCSVVGNTNYELLEYLLSTYEKNLSRDLHSLRFLEPFKFTKLKNHIGNTLTFFHFCWQNMKERVSDDYAYLDKMTEIVRIYLDLEVLFSSSDSDFFDNVSANILRALHIYLDNSEEHVFKVLLKSKYATKAFSRIYSPIFKKYFSNLKSSAEFITNFAYARYLLAFKLWKKIVVSQEEKDKITDMALIKLGSSMPNMGPELSKFFPKPPEGHQNGTLWLMQSNVFDFRKACDGFLMLEENMHSFSLSEEFEEINLNGSNTSFLQPDLETDFQQKTCSELDQISKKKTLPKRVIQKLKPGEVLSIDLTSEDEEVKQININKEKIKKKQQWLKEAKIHRKFKKPQLFPKRTKLVEVADAHSTESCENFEKTRSESALLSKTAKSFDKYSVSSLVEENIVSSQTNMCQKFNITSKTAIQISASDKNNADLVKLTKTSLDDSKPEKSSSSRQDIVHSSTTYVTSVCDKLRPSVLHNESIDIFNYASEDISCRSGRKLLTDWDNRSDKADICAVSTTVGDHISESSSGAWTDYNSVDSEVPDVITSPKSEIFINSCKIQREDISEEPKLGGSLTTMSDPDTPEKTIDVCLSETVVRTSPNKLDSIWTGEMNMEEFQKFSEYVASYSDHHIPSDSLLGDSCLDFWNPTGILKAIDPNLLRKEPDDFETSNIFSGDPLPSFENEERIEMKEEPEEVKVSDELAVEVENTVERGNQTKEEVSSTSRKMPETQEYNARHKRNSAGWRNLMETESPKRRKRSRRSSSLLSNTEDLFIGKGRVQLPFKKRCHKFRRETILEKNMGVIEKDA